jgi:hypothetical protein
MMPMLLKLITWTISLDTATLLATVVVVVWEGMVPKVMPVDKMDAVVDVVMAAVTLLTTPLTIL